MGGTDDPSNIAYLTPEEHADAHKKLYEEHGKLEDFLAWRGLSGRINDEESIRVRCALGGKKGGKKLLGKPKTEEHKRNVSLGLKGKKQTPEHVKNVSEALKGGKSRFSKVYRFTSPNGEVFIERGLNDFCRRNGLSQGNMHGVATGRREHNKGWKCEKIDDQLL